MALRWLYQTMWCCQFVLLGMYQKMWFCLFGSSDTYHKMCCCLFGTSGTVPEVLVLSIWYFWCFTGRCGVAYLELRRLTIRCVVPIWYFWDCTRRCGVAYLVLLGLYQKVCCCLFGTSNTFPECVVLLLGTLETTWGCFLPNWYLWNWIR